MRKMSKKVAVKKIVEVLDKKLVEFARERARLERLNGRRRRPR
jgi:hypothetical protein